MLLLLSGRSIAAIPEIPKSGQTITLHQAYDRALATDQSISNAWQELLKAKLLPWSALTTLGPQILGGVAYNDSNNTTAAGGGNFSYQQTLFDASVFPAWKYGRLASEAARLQYRLTIRNTLYGVATAYYTVLKDRSLVEVNKEIVSLANGQLDLAQKRYDVGEVARTDILRAKAAYEADRQTLIESQNTLAVDRNTLGNILNLGGDNGYQLTQPDDAPPTDTPFDDALSTAYQHREDFKIAIIAVEQSMAKRGQVIGQYLPTVVAQATKGWNSITGAGNSDTWNAGIAVQVPFFTSGQREIDLQNSGYNINEAKLSLEQQAKSVQSDVKTTWLAVRTLNEDIAASKAQVDAAAQNYQDLVNQYRAGASTSLDVQQALSDLSTAQTSYSTNVFDYQVALRNLERAQALFQADRVDTAKPPKPPSFQIKNYKP